MPRPRKPATPYIKSILKTASGVYSVNERGVTYHLTFEQFNHLKNLPNNSVEAWYNNLDRFAKKEVKREGNIPKGDDGFYPDE